MIRGEGILLHASLVFGFDHDDNSIFEKTLEFLVKNKVPSATFNILTPYPGTALFDRFKREGRLLGENWQDYNHRTVVFRPKNLTPEELAEGLIWLGKNFYTKTSIFSRLFYNLHHPLLYLSINWAQRRDYQDKGAEDCLPPPVEPSPIPYSQQSV